MTKAIYEEVTNEVADTTIKRTDADGKVWWIPSDPNNSDYQRYLRWLENPDADEAQSLQIMPQHDVKPKMITAGKEGTR